MITQQVIGQIGFLDYMPPKRQVLPQFHKGQPIFVRSLDVVLSATIGRSWLCGEKNDSPYYGYDIDFSDGSHTVLWDYNIGNTLFADEPAAQIAAIEAKNLLVKINPENMDLLELKSYGYIRELDNHALTATLAKVGENQIYEHEFMCYHFLRRYSDRKKRDKTYQELLTKIQREAEMNNACEMNPPTLEVLYKVDNSMYASRGFAERALQGK